MQVPASTPFSETLAQISCVVPASLQLQAGRERVRERDVGIHIPFYFVRVRDWNLEACALLKT